MYSRNLSAPAFAADFPPDAPKFNQRTLHVRLINLCTSDKKSSHKIRHSEIPRVHHIFRDSSIEFLWTARRISVKTPPAAPSASLRRPRLRQAEDKFRAHPFGTHHINIFPVGLYDLLHDRQPQPGSLLIFSPRQIRFIKTLPDLINTVLRDADAGILDGDKDFFIPHRGLYIDDRIIEAEFNGVIDQVIENLLDLPQIRMNHL